MFSLFKDEIDMKKLAIISLLTVLPFISTNSMAAEGFYVKALGGMAFGNARGLNSVEQNVYSVSSGVDTSDKSTLLGGAVGYNLRNLPISMELEALHVNNQSFRMSTVYPNDVPVYREYSNINLKSDVYLFNTIYSFAARDNFVPFIGAGIGVARNKVSGTFTSLTQAGFAGTWRDSTKTNFAYDLTAGVNYLVTSHVGVSLAYQYLSLGKVATEGNYVGNNGTSGPQTLSTDSINEHNVMLGVSYMF